METGETALEIAPGKRKTGMPAGKLIGKTQTALELVLENSVSPEIAYRVVTGNQNPSRTALHNFKKKVDRYSLKHPKAQKTAYHGITAIAAGEDVNGIKPKSSDVLAACIRVIDAVEPVQRTNVNVNVDIPFLPIDLERYR